MTGEVDKGETAYGECPGLFICKPCMLTSCGI